MKFTFRKPPMPPTPAAEPPAAAIEPTPVAPQPVVPHLDTNLPYTKLEMHWTVVDGKLVCEWRQQPD